MDPLDHFSVFNYAHNVMRQTLGELQQLFLQETQEAGHWCLPGVVYECGGSMHEKVNCPCSCRSTSGPFNLIPLGFIIPNLNCILLCWTCNLCGWHETEWKPWSVVFLFEFNSFAVLFSFRRDKAVAAGMPWTSGVLQRRLRAYDTCQETCFHEWITSLYFS